MEPLRGWCGAAWKVTPKVLTMDAEASKKDLVADRVIELLVSVLRANTENVDLYKQTAGVFWNMSVVDERACLRNSKQSEPPEPSERSSVCLAEPVSLSLRSLASRV